MQKIKSSIKVLIQNAKPFKNVKIIPKAAGSSIGKIDLTIGLHSGSHTVNNHDINSSADNKITVPIETLDKIAKDHGIEKINFIKIDVEGFEVEVLTGMQNILKKYSPNILVAIHGVGEDETMRAFERVLQLLWRNGYHCMSVENNRYIQEPNPNIPRQGHIYASANKQHIFYSLH